MDDQSNRETSVPKRISHRGHREKTRKRSKERVRRRLAVLFLSLSFSSSFLSQCPLCPLWLILFGGELRPGCRGAEGPRLRHPSCPSPRGQRGARTAGAG